MEKLEELTRGELQALAKTHGIKANKKNAELIAELGALAEVAEARPVAADGNTEERGRKSVGRKRKSEAPAAAAEVKFEEAAQDRSRKSVGRKRKSEARAAEAEMQLEEVANVDPASAPSKSSEASSELASCLPAPDYASLTRPQLQAMAKERGFKANAKTSDLIKMLQGSESGEKDGRKSAGSRKSATPDAPDAAAGVPLAKDDLQAGVPQADEKVSAHNSVVASMVTPKADGPQAENGADVAEDRADRVPDGSAVDPSHLLHHAVNSASAVEQIPEATPPPPKRASTASSRRSSATRREAAIQASVHEAGAAAASPKPKMSASTRRSSALSGGSGEADVVDAAGAKSASNERRSSAAGRLAATSLESLPSISTLSPRSSLHTMRARSSVARASLDTPTSGSTRGSDQAGAAQLAVLPENEERKPKRDKSSLLRSSAQACALADTPVVASPMSAALSAAGEAAALAHDAAIADDDYGATVISVMQNGVRTLIHLESPDNAPASRCGTRRSSARKEPQPAQQPQAQVQQPHKERGKKKLGSQRADQGGTGARKVGCAGKEAGGAMGVKGAGIVKAGPEKLKRVMKKGKLPDFTWDARSIFINRNTAAAAAATTATKPSGSAAVSHAPKLTNKENTAAAAASKPSQASSKLPSTARPLSATTSNTNTARAAAAASKQPNAPVTGAARRQSTRNAEGADKGGDVPKGAVVTSLVVAAAPGPGRQRKSSEEVFLPAGLPCFVT